MEIIITQWALNAYLNLKHDRVFSNQEFQVTLKPDVLLLNHFPKHTKFSFGKFWSIAKEPKGNIIANGFKMKWHQIGNGNVQLRLPVAMLGQAILCEAYVKSDEKIERRKLAKFKTHIELIQQGQYKQCGVVI